MLLELACVCETFRCGSITLWCVVRFRNPLRSMRRNTRRFGSVVDGEIFFMYAEQFLASTKVTINFTLLFTSSFAEWRNERRIGANHRSHPLSIPRLIFPQMLRVDIQRNNFFPFAQQSKRERSRN